MIQQSHSYVYIYPEKMKTLIHKDICTPVFIDTPFTIAKTQKETKCPSTYPHRLAYKDVVCVCVCVCVYNWILHSHKKNEKQPFATTWVDLENIILSEVSQTEKYKYYMISLIWGI